MVSAKEVKSIDLASFTTITTAINVLLAVIVTIILSIVLIMTPGTTSLVIYLIPTVIVATLMYGIYQNFITGYIYNFLATKFKSIKFILKDEKEIVKITTTETAIMVSIITTIEVILLYLVSVFIVPLILTGVMQTLMYAGQQTLALGIYNMLMLLSQPTTIMLLIFGTFIICFVFVLIGTYVYNYIAKIGKGAVVSLSKENNFTVLESIDPLKLAIAFGLINIVLSVIMAIVGIISGVPILNAIGTIIEGLISGFIGGALIAIFYNFLAPKLGKLKIELIDY